MQESLLTASHLHFYFHSHFHFRVHFLFKIDKDSRSNAPFKPPCYLHSLCMSLGNACPLFFILDMWDVRSSEAESLAVVQVFPTAIGRSLKSASH